MIKLKFAVKSWNAKTTTKCWQSRKIAQMTTLRKHSGRGRLKSTQIKTQLPRQLMPLKKWTPRWHVFQTPQNVDSMIRWEVQRFLNNDSPVLGIRGTMALRKLLRLKICSTIFSLGQIYHVVKDKQRVAHNSIDSSIKKHQMHNNYWDNLAPSCWCSYWVYW